MSLLENGLHSKLPNLPILEPSQAAFEPFHNVLQTARCLSHHLIQYQICVIRFTLTSCRQVLADKCLQPPKSPDRCQATPPLCVSRSRKVDLTVDVAWICMVHGFLLATGSPSCMFTKSFDPTFSLPFAKVLYAVRPAKNKRCTENIHCQWPSSLQCSLSLSLPARASLFFILFREILQQAKDKNISWLDWHYRCTRQNRSDLFSSSSNFNHLYRVSAGHKRFLSAIQQHLPHGLQEVLWPQIFSTELWINVKVASLNLVKYFKLQLHTSQFGQS